MVTTASPGMESYRASVTQSFSGVVSGLRGLLGAKLVAYIGGVKETRAVRQWASGERVPGDETVLRLRLTYRVAGLIAESQQASGVLQAWFQGANPQLGEQSPARVLREHRAESAESVEVLSAAMAFARVG